MIYKVGDVVRVKDSELIAKRFRGAVGVVSRSYTNYLGDKVAEIEIYTMHDGKQHIYVRHDFLDLEENTLSMSCKFRVGDIVCVKTEDVQFDDIRHLSKWAARQIRKRKKLIASVIDVHKELEDVYINAVEIEFENGKRELVNPNILEYYGDTHLPEVTKEEVRDFLWD